ncbi:hypothetical protein ADK60_08615 [Streptomyces sp. XY431]|nr:hypothetical protein ADK60_08615 [Streptomyces sp. XY431]
MLVPRAINRVPAVDQVNRRINLPFASSPFGYVLSNTVRSADRYSTDAHGNALRALFGPTGWICRFNGGAPAVRSYGFLTLSPGACGAVVHI